MIKSGEEIPVSRMSLYCILLYLYIYIALLAVHTNQKRYCNSCLSCCLNSSSNNLKCIA